MPTPLPDVPPSSRALSPQGDRALFRRRSARVQQRIDQALTRLYGSEDRAQAWRDYFYALAEQALSDRPADLRALDDRRLEQSDWFQRPDMIGYTCYVDRFGGDLRGLAQRLDYLAELGIRYLHLLPIFKPRAGDSDGGYAVADYLSLNPAYGTMADLSALAAALRARGISLVADLALNHTADDHAWAAAACAGDPWYRSYYWVLDSQESVTAYEAALDQVFPDSAPGNFTRVEALGGWVWTTFYPFQWDLNWSNPAVFGEMLRIILTLTNRGIEVLRLDSVAYLWKRLGTDCMNQPEVHAILQALRGFIEIACPALLLKAETIVAPAHLTQYLGTGEAANTECHLSYHSVLMAGLWQALADQDTRVVAHMLGRMPPIPDRTAWLTYVRCHDDIGWRVLAEDLALLGKEAVPALKQVADFYAGRGDSFARGADFQTGAAGHAVHGTNGATASLAGLERAETAAQQAAAIDRILLLYGLIFAFNGIPLIYMGDELGLMNDWSAVGDAATDGRWLHRRAMDWRRADQRGDADSPAGRLFAGFRRLAQARAGCAELHAAEPFEVLQPGDPRVLAFRRGARLVVLGNVSARPAAVPTDALGLAGPVRDRLDPAAGLLADPVPLRPYACRWLVAEPDR